MTRMYVANCTNQDHAFLYQLPENPATFLQDIGVGQQVVLAKDLSGPDIDAIVEHHARYGMISVDQVGKVRNRMFPLVYSVGRSVPLQKMSDQIELNKAVLVERGKESRIQAAVQSNEYIERTMRDMQLPDRIESLNMEIVEEHRDTTTDNSPEVAEGIRVDRSAPRGTPSKPTRGRPRVRRTT